MEKESKSVGLEKEDALNQARWRVGVGVNVVTPIYGDKSDQYSIYSTYTHNDHASCPCYFSEVSNSN